MIIADSVVEEEASDEGGNVGRVAGHEDDGEAAPHVDQELVGPRLGRFEGHQVSTQQTPAYPQCGGHAVMYTYYYQRQINLTPLFYNIESCLQVDAHFRTLLYSVFYLE